MADQTALSEKPKGADQPGRVKRLLVAQLASDYGRSTNLLVVQNLGLNSEQTLEMRSSMRAKSIRMRVVRNRLALRAFGQLGLAEAGRLFAGPAAIVAADDPVAAAKMVVEFSRKFAKKLVVAGGLLDGKVLSPKEVEGLAASKNKPELLAEIAGLVLGVGRNLGAWLLGPGRRVAGAIKSHARKLEEQQPEAKPAA